MEVVVSFAVGLFELCVILKLLSLPLSMVWKLVTNSIAGAFVLWLLNLLGLGIKITFIKSLIVGVFGIPGVLFIMILHFL